MSRSRFWYLFSKKMTGEASPDELLALEKLVKEHPDWAHSAELMHGIWESKEQKDDRYEAELAFELHLDRLKENGIHLPDSDAPVRPFDFTVKTARPRSKRILLISLAAACLLAIVSIFSLKLLPQNNHTASGTTANSPEVPSEVYTRPGSRTRLVLPDSTIVWLNAGSKLTYDKYFGINNRNTTLTGEAFYDVRKNAIPFIIHTRGLQVRAIGTAFNVKSYPDDNTIETSLLRGKVEITLDNRPGEKFILNPNEKLTVANDRLEDKKVLQEKDPLVVLSQLTHTADNNIVETCWVDNKLLFQNESFAELAHKMERWYGVTIRFADERIAKQRLSGTFTTETVQEALEELQMTTVFSYTLKSNVIVISGD